MDSGRQTTNLSAWTAGLILILPTFALPCGFAQETTAEVASVISTSEPEAPNSEVVRVENALLKTLEATTLSAEVSGRIAELSLQEGQRVKTDQTLGKVNDRSAVLQLQQAKTAMARARLKFKSDIELRLAESRTEVSKNELDRAIVANTRIADTFPLKEVERLTLIHQTNLLEVERAQYEQRIGELEILQTEDLVLSAEELVDRHLIKSPVDGLILSIRRRVGEWVEPGTEVVQIVNLDRLRIEGFIPATLALDVAVDSKAVATLFRGKQELRREARVAFVSPDVNPSTGQVRIFLELSNTDSSLSPGLRAEVAIPIHGPNQR